MHSAQSQRPTTYPTSEKFCGWETQIRIIKESSAHSTAGNWNTFPATQLFQKRAYALASLCLGGAPNWASVTHPTADLDRAQLVSLAASPSSSSVAAMAQASLGTSSEVATRPHSQEQEGHQLRRAPPPVAAFFCVFVQRTAASPPFLSLLTPFLLPPYSFFLISVPASLLLHRLQPPTPTSLAPTAAAARGEDPLPPPVIAQERASERQALCATLAPIFPPPPPTPTPFHPLYIRKRKSCCCCCTTTAAAVVALRSLPQPSRENTDPTRVRRGRNNLSPPFFLSASHVTHARQPSPPDMYLVPTTYVYYLVYFYPSYFNIEFVMLL